jgi:hypothetical protein
MNRISRIAFTLFCLGVTFVFSGCFSAMFGRVSSDDMTWWDDKNQCQVGNPETYVPGLTVYDPVTGKDVPKKGVTQEEVDQAIRERLEAKQEAMRHYEAMDESEKAKWYNPLGLIRKKSSQPAEEKQIDEPKEIKPQKSRWWKFWGN